MKILVTGGKGFIGSHLVDALIEQGHEITIVDNGVSGDNLNEKAKYLGPSDIMNYQSIKELFTGIDIVFHMAAIARTPWCVKKPFLCYNTNVMGSLNVLEAARAAKVKKVILSSSNIVYAAETPYKQSKLAMEGIAKVYNDLYGLATVCLRYSNVYGTRQREDGESPNVFAAFRKSKRLHGRIRITGDGEQTRDFTHVSDIVKGNILAMEKGDGVIDLCTGRNVSMNYVATQLFQSVVEYVPEREGDIKHIRQSPFDAKLMLGWHAHVPLEEGIKDVL